MVVVVGMVGSRDAYMGPHPKLYLSILRDALQAAIYVTNHKSILRICHLARTVRPAAAAGRHRCSDVQQPTGCTRSTPNTIFVLSSIYNGTAVRGGMHLF